MIKFKINWRGGIDAIDIKKETNHFVAYCQISHEGRRGLMTREKKDGKIFDTWQEARAHLLDKARAQVESLEQRLQQQWKYIGELEDMTEPEAQTP